MGQKGTGSFFVLSTLGPPASTAGQYKLCTKFSPLSDGESAGSHELGDAFSMG